MSDPRDDETTAVTPETTADEQPTSVETPAGEAVADDTSVTAESAAPASTEDAAPVADDAPLTDADAPSSVEDVVGSANAGLAEAEAASRDAVSSDELDEAHHDLSYIEAAGPEPEAEATEVTAATVVAPVADPASEAPTVVVEPTAITPSEPTAPAAPAAAPQPIFVQAPEAPRPRGNRGAAGLIGLLAAVVFGALYLIAALVLDLGLGNAAVADLGQNAIDIVTSSWFWVTVAVFFLAFWLLGAIINRGRWGQWVIFGLLIGVVAYGGHIVGQLVAAPFWELTARQGGVVVEEQLLAPLAIIAFVLGREVTIWFGAWVASRGARVTELNNEAQREYERTLEAGPQLHHL